MQYNTQDERAYARAFPQSLEGAAAGWFDDLPTDSVDSWHTLSRLFTERHGAGLTYEKNETELMEVHQKPGETIRAYYERYEATASEIHHVDDRMYRIGFHSGLRFGPLKHSLITHEVRSKSQLAARIEKYMNAEEAEAREARTPL